MADKKLAKVGITIKEPWRVDVSYEMLDFTLWRVQDGGDGCGYIAKRDNIGVVPNSDDSVWIPASQAGQSIYDLAVKYGHFEGTEEEFEAEYQAVLQAARDAASETSATNTEIQEAEELRKTAENARVEAETARQTAESARQTAETARETAETARETAETQRGENETTRQSQEDARESSETQRQSNESTRQSNETSRESAELERTADFEGLKTDMQTAIQQADAATAAAVALNNQVAGDESARQTAESGRVAAETQRQSNETQRGTNESTRQSQEAARQTAEQTRNTQEGTRQTQETARQTAEQGRAGAESQRVSNETARQQAETARETQATTDHQRAESDHAIAEEDHATLDEKISHKADIDGSYDGMAVGIARNLEGRTDVTDSFFKRTTGGEAEVANGTAQLNEVKGKSQVWNQLVMNPNFESTDYWSALAGITFSVQDNEAIITITSAASSHYFSQQGKVLAGHKYYARFSFKSTALGYNDCLIGACIIAGANALPAIKQLGSELNTWYTLRVVITAPEDYGYLFRLSGWSAAGGENRYKNMRLHDLTLLGIDNLETVDEVEAWLAENIGEQAYYPYNAGEVLNNRMTGVESIGFNLLDPATGKADIIGAYSDVYGNYYGITGTHGTLTFTDKFGNTETITPDEDGKFLLEKAGTLSVADAGEDCAVFLWWDGTQTEYKPYEKNVGALDVTHIYGKLNGEGEYVRVWPTGMPGIGDIKDSLKVVDGQVVAERKVGEVDMGTITWTGEGNNVFSASRSRNGLKQDTPAVCGKYVYVGLKSVSALNDKELSGGGSGSYLMVKDTAYSTGSDFKNASTGIMLYCELATPQVYTDLIYRDSEDFADGTPVTLPVNYKVDNWGVERVVPKNTKETVVTAKPELTMRYSIDAVETMNTHSDQIEDLYEKNEELDHRKPEKYGEYPDMAVGSAKTLAGQDTKVEDFVFKAIDCADGIAKLNSVRGKSLVMNQLISINSRDVSKTQNGVTITDNRDGSFTVSTDSEGATEYVILGFAFIRVAGHKYLLKGCPRNGSSSTYALVGNALGNDYGNGTISTMSESGNLSFPRIAVYTGAIITSPVVFRPQLFDLTLMFGAGNEPATVEEFEAMFPLPYYDYNPGEIISNKTEEVKVVGFNQWDEEWEQGSINTINGNNRASTTQVRSKNYIKVIANRQYFLLCADLRTRPANNVGLAFYDSGKSFIGLGDGNNSVFTIPSNCSFLRFWTINTYGGTYKNDICLNLSDPARNGEYEPYKTNTIELNLPTLTGKLNGEGESVVVFPDGLKSAGSVYDEIVGNKAIKRVGVVDLGDFDYTYRTAETDFLSSVFDKFPKEGGYSISPIYANSQAAGTQGQSDKSIRFTATGKSIIKDSSYTDAATFKSAMDGILLYYELSTPEEYILDAPLPDTFQAYKGGTIKQLPENTSEPVTAPCVMLATYSIDAVATLVGLPRNYVSKESLQAMLNAMQSAGIIASYTMTYNENTGKYDFTFVAPTNS